MQRLFNAPAQVFGTAADHLINTVQRAPEHKGQIRAVPQSAAQKNDHNIEIFTQPAFTIAAQRNI